MADNFVAEIRIFAGNFAPTGWALCDGQLLPISQNTALFSLVGTMYGGNGQSTFGLPNLQGRAPMDQGQGPGLTARQVGDTGGTDTVTLLQAQLPAHAHPPSPSTASSSTADRKSPVGGVVAVEAANVTAICVDDAGPQGAMAPEAAAMAGGGQPHNNLQPYLTLTFIIALQGIFPSHS